MKYAVEIGSGSMIYVPGFIKIGLAIRHSKINNEGHIYTQTET
jgi:hypothetical protein